MQVERGLTISQAGGILRAMISIDAHASIEAAHALPGEVDLPGIQKMALNLCASRRTPSRKKQACKNRAATRQDGQAIFRLANHGRLAYFVCAEPGPAQYCGGPLGVSLRVHERHGGTGRRVLPREPLSANLLDTISLVSLFIGWKTVMVTMGASPARFACGISEAQRVVDVLGSYVPFNTA